LWDVIFGIPLQSSENRTIKIDDPMTFGYGIDATDSAWNCGTTNRISVHLGFDVTPHRTTPSEKLDATG
jgi:hypothetical protein